MQFAVIYGDQACSQRPRIWQLLPNSVSSSLLCLHIPSNNIVFSFSPKSSWNTKAGFRRGEFSITPAIWHLNHWRLQARKHLILSPTPPPAPSHMREVLGRAGSTARGSFRRILRPLSKWYSAQHKDGKTQRPPEASPPEIPAANILFLLFLTVPSLSPLFLPLLCLTLCSQLSCMCSVVPDSSLPSGL